MGHWDKKKDIPNNGEYDDDFPNPNVLALLQEHQGETAQTDRSH